MTKLLFVAHAHSTMLTIPDDVLVELKAAI
jgi:hypothetical protein